MIHNQPLHVTEGIQILENKAIVGLAMYSSSRAAACAYCSGHTCSFALRRGTTTAALVGNRAPREATVVAVAEGLSRCFSGNSIAHLYIQW